MGIEHQLQKVKKSWAVCPCTVCLLDFLWTSFEFAELGPHFFSVWLIPSAWTCLRHSRNSVKEIQTILTLWFKILCRNHTEITGRSKWILHQKTAPVSAGRLTPRAFLRLRPFWHVPEYHDTRWDIHGSEETMTPEYCSNLSLSASINFKKLCNIKDSTENKCRWLKSRFLLLGICPTLSCLTLCKVDWYSKGLEWHSNCVILKS